MTKTQSSTQTDYVSSSLADEKLHERFDDFMHHENARRRMKDIIGEYADSVPFSEKVKKYAREEIDIQVFRGVKYWVGTIVVPIAITIITAVILHKLGWT